MQRQSSHHPSHASLSLVVGLDRRTVSDGDLARGLMAGDTWAIAEAWRRFAPMVLMLASRSLGSRTEAEDIAQEVFHKIYRKAKTLREPDSLRSFIYGCTLHALQSELRRKRLRSWLSLHEPETLANLGSRTLDVESQDVLRRFKKLLDRLSPRERLVFTLRRMESMTVEEIAAAMAISVSTVKRSMTHASDRLTRWIQADPGLADLLTRERSEL
jgi:RNA polymerase sigma factor (sigma-70 family)